MATERTVPLGSVELRITESRPASGGAGRPLLLVHGLGGNRTDFEDHVDALAATGWHVVAPDLRGHGESTKVGDEAAYSLEAFAGDLVGLADALGWSTFVLLGHSLGGMAAQVLALHHGDRLDGLILMDTTHRNFDTDPDLVAFGTELARTQGMDAIADILKQMPSPLETAAHRRMCELDPDYAERGDRNLRLVDPAMYASMINQVTTFPSRLDALRALPVPTLVLVGAEDDAFLPPSRELAAAIPGARLVVLDGGGHSPQFEVSDAWRAAMADFLDALPPDASSPTGVGAVLDEVRS